MDFGDVREINVNKNGVYEFKYSGTAFEIGWNTCIHEALILTQDGQFKYIGTAFEIDWNSRRVSFV